MHELREETKGKVMQMPTMAMRRLWAAPLMAVAVLLAVVTPAQAGTPQANTPQYGTVSGTLTAPGGALLDGMCVNLYKGSYSLGNAITTAPTGSGGNAGAFTQANVPVGNYVAFFYNCGANLNGNADPNYVDIFYGNTYIPSKATKFTVTARATTSLGTNAIPIGGTISGTVTDANTGSPALYDPPVGIEIPGAGKLNLDSTQGWYIVCANSEGSYTVSGVPTGGVKVVFAPTNWGCPYSGSSFNFGFYNQSVSSSVHLVSEGTATKNGAVTEGGSYPSGSSTRPANLRLSFPGGPARS